MHTFRPPGVRIWPGAQDRWSESTLLCPMTHLLVFTIIYNLSLEMSDDPKICRPYKIRDLNQQKCRRTSESPRPGQFTLQRRMFNSSAVGSSLFSTGCLTVQTGSSSSSWNHSLLLPPCIMQQKNVNTSGDSKFALEPIRLAFQRHKKESEETPWLERNFLALVVAEAWLEQTTFGLWAQRATNCSTPRCFLFAGAKVRLFFDSANFLRYFFVFSWPYRKKTLLLLKLLAIVQWQYPKQEPNWWT